MIGIKIITMEELDEIIDELAILGNVLFNKFGTDSYDIRCYLHDIKEQLIEVNKDLYAKRIQ